MNKRLKRKFSADFKVKVVLEAIKERSTIEELAKKFELHPNQIGTWKKEFLSKATNVFSSAEGSEKQDQEKLIQRLYTEIGQQKVEIDWLKKKL